MCENWSNISTLLFEGIWDMLLGKICQRPGEPDLLAQYKFFACLDQRCNDYYIKTVYFNDSLRKNVYAAVGISYLLCDGKCIEIMKLKN